jgi:hypothetical protein
MNLWVFQEFIQNSSTAFSINPGEEKRCKCILCVKIASMSLKVVFMGSPEFALPTLRSLAAHYHVAGVITQPDRPAGRGRTLKPPPVKTLAETLGIETIQPARMRAGSPGQAACLAAGSDCGHGIWADPAPKRAGFTAIRLHQRACFFAASLAGCSAHSGSYFAW